MMCLTGKPEDMQKLLDFLHRSVHDACINRKTTIATLTEWITALREKGIEENDRIVNDQDAGRSSNPEQQPKYIKIWSDLMLRYKDQKDEAVKITRYNRVPDHLVGKVELLKCNSAFLPDPRSVGQGAGKEDQAEASKTIQKRKQEALERQLDEGDDAGTGKTLEDCRAALRRAVPAPRLPHSARHGQAERRLPRGAEQRAAPRARAAPAPPSLYGCTRLEPQTRRRGFTRA